MMLGEMLFWFLAPTFFHLFSIQIGNNTHQQITTTDASKDNRLQAKNMRQLQQANATAAATSGVGGARLRIPTSQNNQEVIMKDLQSLQTSIEELMG